MQSELNKMSYYKTDRVNWEKILTSYEVVLVMKVILEMAGKCQETFLKEWQCQFSLLNWMKCMNTINQNKLAFEWSQQYETKKY